ncbi:type II secretion system protein [Stutzerimonas stutzeri]|uniref:type II secretion system protein GspM n=1 Tax=Stutzerimonas stutzeri TaxID=316 RepID=UPI0024A3BFC9|nr:type II secretion system protein GspM [Stutzerimonas stutzeri]GLZ23994.1 type II secretion system protein [Stutzerimonas stutzeri]
MSDRLRQSGFVDLQLARWRNRRGQLVAHWQRLAARERRILKVAALGLAVLFSWFGLIEPPLEKMAHWQAELPRLHSQSVALEEVLRDMAPIAGEPVDLWQRLRQSLDTSPLNGHYRLAEAAESPPDPIRVLFMDAPAGPLMAWLQHSAPALRLTITEAHLRRASATDTNGPVATVSGDIRLEPAQTAKETR